MALVIASCGISAEQHFEVGLELHQQGRFEEAIQDYDEAIRLDPQRIEAYNNRGRAYLNLDQAQKAIEDFDQVLRLDPQLAEAYYNRGLAHDRLGQNEKAKADFDQAIALDPELERSIVGKLFHKGENLKKAIEILDEVIRLNPGFADDHLTRGNMYLFLGKPQPALEDFDEAIGLNAELTAAYRGRALAYTLLDKDEEAKQNADRAIELGIDATALGKAIEGMKAKR